MLVEKPSIRVIGEQSKELCSPIEKIYGKQEIFTCAKRLYIDLSSFLWYNIT